MITRFISKLFEIMDILETGYFPDFQHFLDIMICYSLRYSCSDVIRKNYTNSNLELNGMKLNLTELNQVITKKLKLIPNNNNNRIY